MLKVCMFISKNKNKLIKYATQEVRKKDNKLKLRKAERRY